MNDCQWQARIERAGRILGSGFLIAGRTVLTCAHVVAGADGPLTVTFPNRRSERPVEARVLVGAGWHGDATAPGDLAVLELAREVDVAPARFGTESEAYAGADGRAPTLHAYGFPKSFDEGTQAAYRTVSPTRVRDEWVELVADLAHGQPLRSGFSGAALTVAGTNRVVGIVTSVTGGAGTMTGRMMPLSVMVRYWEDLVLYLPGPARLNALVEKALRTGLDCRPERLYRQAAGPWAPPVPSHELRSLPMAAWHALNAPEPEVAERFADRLEELLGESARERPGRAPAAWTPVVFTVEHSGAGEDEVRVTVSAYHEGHPHLVEEPRTLPSSEVPGYVESVIDTAIDHLPDDTDELVAFELPRPFLNWPVDRWPAGDGDPTPLGCAYPVVVTAHSRREGGRRRRLAKSWRARGDRPASGVHRVDCSDGPPPSQSDLARADVVGFAAPPGPGPRPHFDTALAKPVPVLLWPRTGCAGGHEDGTPCPGTAFLDALGTYVSGLPLDELPQHIMALRERASAQEQHWAHDIQLLWDSPRCFPAPDREALHRHCPVA
ncbi:MULTISPECIES: VMAP-C domain-containing protein [Streptomyces]|uniref:Trypsin-like peptidase domain-containing protein n=1 Tax=Streptomyces xanthii TaxID=2768069 RepID=A0A7H1BCF4_9ACTN|nr:trypsin-like peptidase domain-containing protein [Streptomyces xanthii]QNS06409.1 trypsin-like peptidase domain-containing protein [Streptomyces xanthii]